MRTTIFNAIVTLLQGITKLQSETGQVHVYDWPITAPAGYPYVTVQASRMESDELSNMQDVRRYFFTVQVVGEKFGDQAGKTQSQALAVMRETEDAIFDAFDADNDLGLGNQIIVTRPIQDDWAVSGDNTRVVLTMTVMVEAAVDITR